MIRFTPIALIVLIFSAQSQASKYTVEWPDEKELGKGAPRDFYKKAINKAYTRLFADDDVLKCIYKIAKTDFVDKETVIEHHGEDFYKNGKLFKTQIENLKHHHNTGHDLPDIQITTGFEDSFAWAWGKLGLVHTIQEEKSWSWKGKFVVQLNRDKFLQGDTDVWAGLIAHEMLHNMMHTHEDGRKVGLEKAYSSDILINAAQNCVVNASDVRDHASTNRCGGREAKE